MNDMRRFFILAVALAAMTGIASAQDYDMYVEDADGAVSKFKVENVAKVSVFEEDWQAYAIGDYSYDLGLFGPGAVDSGLVLYRSTLRPDHYRIADWGMWVDFSFTYDEGTGEVRVDDQTTGGYMSGYGEVFVVEVTDFLSASYSTSSSYFDAGANAFNFAVCYYCSLGFFSATGYDGAPYETFTVTEYVESADAPGVRKDKSAVSIAEARVIGMQATAE